MYRTRGIKRSENLEDEIVEIYTRFGARLVEAHGSLATANENKNISWTVPKDTVVIFLAKPGRCMFIGAGRILAEKYFKSHANLLRFFVGSAGREGIHHGEILSRTFFEGDKCPSVSLVFKHSTFPSFGYVWKLPLSRTRTVTEENLELEPPPLRSEVYTQVKHGSSLLLKTVIQRLGKGVYIVNACLPPGNFKTNEGGGTNAPNKPTNNWPSARQSSRTREHVRYTHFIKKSIRPPKAGTPRKTHLPYNQNYKVRHPKLLARPVLTVRELLSKLSKNPNMNLTNSFKKLRANVNTNKISTVQNILKNSKNYVSKLGRLNRMRWKFTTNKAHFIYSTLLKDSRA
jgi:hypothetical protein